MSGVSGVPVACPHCGRPPVVSACAHRDGRRWFEVACRSNSGDGAVRAVVGLGGYPLAVEIWNRLAREIAPE